MRRQKKALYSKIFEVKVKCDSRRMQNFWRTHVENALVTQTMSPAHCDVEWSVIESELNSYCATFVN